MKRKIQTCTQGPWGVACKSGDGINGAILSVYRVYTNPKKIGTLEHTKYAYGEGEGKEFPTTEAAYAWALEHGYLQKFFNNGTCSFRKGYWEFIRQMTIKGRTERGQPVTLKRHYA